MNSVWQHDRDHHDDEQDPPILDDHVEDIASQPQISHDTQIYSQIWGDIQDLQPGLNNLTINTNRGFDRFIKELTNCNKDLMTFRTLSRIVVII